MALENVKGIYLITDEQEHEVRFYVGSACGGDGVWSRWAEYISSGHGGNVQLRERMAADGLNYCRSHFHFALLEQLLDTTPDEVVLARENYWKDILRSRQHSKSSRGLNRN